VLVADRDQGAPDAAAQQVPAEQKHEQRHPQGEKYSHRPPPAEFRTGLWFRDDDACTPPVTSRGDGTSAAAASHAEREGGEGEVKPLQAQRRQPNRKPATRHTPPAAGTTAQYGAPACR